MASSSSRRRNCLTDDGLVGDFVIGGEIGKGSFAQVFLGKHRVSVHALHAHRTAHRMSRSPRPLRRLILGLFADLCVFLCILDLRCRRRRQVRRPRPSQQKVKRESLWGNQDPQAPPTPTHRRSPRLRRKRPAHQPDHGVLRTRRSLHVHQET